MVAAAKGNGSVTLSKTFSALVSWQFYANPIRFPLAKHATLPPSRASALSLSPPLNKMNIKNTIQISWSSTLFEYTHTHHTPPDSAALWIRIDMIFFFMYFTLHKDIWAPSFSNIRSNGNRQRSVVFLPFMRFWWSGQRWDIMSFEFTIRSALLYNITYNILDIPCSLPIWPQLSIWNKMVLRNGASALHQQNRYVYLKYILSLSMYFSHCPLFFSNCTTPLFNNISKSVYSLPTICIYFFQINDV